MPIQICTLFLSLKQPSTDKKYFNGRKINFLPQFFSFYSVSGMIMPFMRRVNLPGSVKSHKKNTSKTTSP